MEGLGKRLLKNDVEIWICYWRKIRENDRKKSTEFKKVLLLESLEKK